MARPTTLSLFINIVSITISYWGISQCTKIILPQNLYEAGHKQFLTNISVVVTLINNSANIIYWILEKILPSNEILANCEFISRHITLPIALILESVVPLVYWPLRLFAQNLIMQDIPADIKNPLPLSVDMAIHLSPFICLFSDHYLSGSGSKFEVSNGKAWFIVTALGFSYYKYLSFLIDTNKGQVYPYPFLDVAEPWKSVIFVLVSTVAWLFYVLYQKLPPYLPPRNKSLKKKD